MKAILKLVILVFIGLMGYSYEPILRGTLTSFAFLEKFPGQSRKADTDTDLELSDSFDIEAIPFTKLPRLIYLKENVFIRDSTNETKVLIPAGKKVRFIRSEGDQVWISSMNHKATGSVDITQTDLVEQIAKNRKNPDYVREEEKESPPEEVKIDAKMEAPQVAPPELAAPEASLIKAAPSIEAHKAVIDIMKSSLQTSSIQEFTFEQVKDWKDLELEEDLDGITYRVGLVSYAKQTPFGVKVMEAKAYIFNNKVSQWSGAQSGIQLK